MDREIERPHSMARSWVKILTSSMLGKTSVPHPFYQIIATSQKPSVRPAVKSPILALSSL